MRAPYTSDKFLNTNEFPIYRFCPIRLNLPPVAMPLEATVKAPEVDTAYWTMMRRTITETVKDAVKEETAAQLSPFLAEIRGVRSEVTTVSAKVDEVVAIQTTHESSLRENAGKLSRLDNAIHRLAFHNELRNYDHLVHQAKCMHHRILLLPVPYPPKGSKREEVSKDAILALFRDAKLDMNGIEVFANPDSKIHFSVVCFHGGAQGRRIASSILRLRDILIRAFGIMPRREVPLALYYMRRRTGRFCDELAVKLKINRAHITVEEGVVCVRGRYLFQEFLLPTRIAHIEGLFDLIVEALTEPAHETPATAVRSSYDFRHARLLPLTRPLLETFAFEQGLFE